MEQPLVVLFCFVFPVVLLKVCLFQFLSVLLCTDEVTLPLEKCGLSQGDLKMTHITVNQIILKV